MSRSPLSRFRPLWVACALACAARAEAAGKPPAPTAWVMSFNYGAGSLNMEGDSLKRDFGRGLQLRLGHIVDSRFTAGFQARTWSASESDSLLGSAPASTDLKRYVQLLTLTATMYPSGAGPYVRGGVGICKVRQEFIAHDPLGGPSTQQTHEDAGFAVSAAGGWEYRWRPRLGLTLDLEFTRYVAAHIGGNLIAYSGGFNYYW